MRHTTATIQLSPKQRELIMQVVVGSPWFRRKAKKCRLSTAGGGAGTLEFQFETNSSESHKQPGSDFQKLMDGMLTCRTFGWSERTTEQIRVKLQRAVVQAIKAEDLADREAVIDTIIGRKRRSA